MQSLISTAELLSLTSAVGDARPVIVDCRYRLDDEKAGEWLYHLGHVPGAYYLSLGKDLAGSGPAAAGRHPLPKPELFAQTLGRLGVTAAQTVIAYDDCGGQIAARFWWLCRWVGFERVRMLDGGWPAWLADGGAISQQTPGACDATYTLNLRPDSTVTARLLNQQLADGACLLIDARVPSRFRGEQEPIDPVAGHIPGAVNHPSSENLDANGYFLPAVRLREVFTELLGNWRAEQVVHSCGSGVTACHNLLAMDLAGLDGSKLYAPSWSGWIAQPGNEFLDHFNGDEVAATTGSVLDGGLTG